MIHEHAVTYINQLTIKDLDYLAKKANRLGKLGRDVVHVHAETDAEGTHVYYDVTAMRPPNDGIK